MNTIHLRLKNKIFNKVESGEVTEIYRTIKPYWIKQLCYAARMRDCNEKQGKCADCFRVASQHSGYMCYPFTHAWMARDNTSRFIVREIEDISFGMGKPEWGAPTDKPVFIFRLKKGGEQ